MRRPPIILSAASRRARWHEAGVLALLLFGARVTNPAQPLPIELCLIKRFTGHECLTCGLTRGVCYALRGDWHAAVQLHMAAPLVMVAAVGWLGWALAEAWRGRPLFAR